ncbi:MAG: glycoside hydrolase, partial [Bacteroidales bacterium]|nr:glycoside hydrolase [Bacteroidales bacterium]
LYNVWKLFPDQVDPQLILDGMNYIYGCHPYSNVSFITGVGVSTKKVAYGNNRADYTVIPGGLVPGLLIMAPDYLECKDDYPFHWGENECCTRNAVQIVVCSLACEEIARTLE